MYKNISSMGGDSAKIRVALRSLHNPLLTRALQGLWHGPYRELTMLPLVFYRRTEGPYKRFFGHNQVTYYFVLKDGYRQAKPYNIDSPCDFRWYWSVGNTNADSWAWGPQNLQFSSFVRAETAALNQARARFVSKLGNSSSFGATLTAERKETWGMIVGTITRAALAAKQVRRMQFHQAARTLGLPYSERTIRTVRYRRNPSIHSARRPRAYVSRQRVISFGDGRQHLKSAASGWLMWSYGVKPLMSDIYNGMDVLQRPCPDQLVTGRGRAEAKVSSSSGQLPSWGTITTRTVTCAVKVSAYVRVNNPNLWLANQLGLVNPVQWLNEAIPFSFVVDWFSNLSQVINQLTDFVGLDVSRPCTARKYVCREANLYYLWGGGSEVTEKTQSVYQRTLTIPTAKLQFAYERFEWQRGLNAISLLVVFLPKKSILS